MVPGSLYVVATPIGNLADITRRAADTLASVDLVAAEDTRRTRKLLSALGISARLLSYREQNRERAGARLVETLTAGQDVALVTDAGTPGLSDPGHHLVRLCVESGIPVIPVPGPSALTAALSVSGVDTVPFLFLGFLPPKPGSRRERLLELLNTGYAIFLYESPQRLTSTLRLIEELAGERQVFVAREMTKVHEEFWRGRASEILEELDRREIKGEVTVLVASGEKAGATIDLTEAVSKLRAAGLSAAQTASVLSGLTGDDRSLIYRMAAAIRQQERK